ncbi:hypothetical protein SAMN05421638_2284 [Kaistella treverensis]|uniref:Uncharacterized protein n=1 Tax=Kaistella treverensis TaxID=631455 RepID=A0A1I3NXX0_9FLAO|nr:hypothetical protein [Kaistella treverensis]SFJ14017.1 hypothetical protein SAMN05421638_2284 [Kaistella treverensis]
MKKILFFFTILSYTAVFSQCYIEGKSVINVGESQVYTVKNNTAKCDDCHTWSSLDNIISLDGNLKQSKLQVKGISGGSTLLAMEMDSDKGLLKCYKTIRVISALPKKLSAVAEECDFDINGFKEMKANDSTVSYAPDNLVENLKYTWIAEYENGEQKSTNEPKANFNFTKENGIKALKLNVKSAHCVRDFTKIYDANYWDFY